MINKTDDNDNNIDNIDNNNTKTGCIYAIQLVWNAWVVKKQKEERK